MNGAFYPYYKQLAQREHGSACLVPGYQDRWGAWDMSAGACRDIEADEFGIERWFPRYRYKPLPEQDIWQGHLGDTSTEKMISTYNRFVPLALFVVIGYIAFRVFSRQE